MAGPAGGAGHGRLHGAEVVGLCAPVLELSLQPHQERFPYLSEYHESVGAGQSCGTSSRCRGHAVAYEVVHWHYLGQVVRPECTLCTGTMHLHEDGNTRMACWII